MKDTILEIIEQNVDQTPVQKDMIVRDITDSLGFCHLVWELETELKVETPDDQVKVLYNGTVEGLVGYFVDLGKVEPIPFVEED